jgi:hydrogenase expression/formation protein HypC
VCTALVPDAAAGDWVLIHAGFAIQQVSEEDAAATFAVLREVDAAGQGDLKRLAGI